mgnify:CR=1 FL=1
MQIFYKNKQIWQLTKNQLTKICNKLGINGYKFNLYHLSTLKSTDKFFRQKIIVDLTGIFDG